MAKQRQRIRYAHAAMLLGIFVLFSCTSAAQGNTTAKQRPAPDQGESKELQRKQIKYKNPLWSGYFADPAVIKEAHCYYAFGTGEAAGGKRFPVLRSYDLVNWQALEGALLPVADPKLKDYWAPEPCKSGDDFILFYSAGSPDGLDHQLRVARSKQPQGPYRDCGKVLIPQEPFSIDPHPFLDDDGRWYLFFVKDELEGERPGTAIAVVPLTADLLSTDGAVRTILKPSADWQVFGRNREWYGRKWKEWYCIEGPYVIKRGGKYYCFYSGGCWETPGYGLAYAVADNVQGPYKDFGTTDGAAVLHGNEQLIGPGHNSIVEGPDGQDYVVYHAWDKEHTARRICIDPLIWKDGVPRCDGPKTEGTMLIKDLSTTSACP